MRVQKRLKKFFLGLEHFSTKGGHMGLTEQKIRETGEKVTVAGTLYCRQVTGAVGGVPTYTYVRAFPKVRGSRNEKARGDS